MREQTGGQDIHKNETFVATRSNEIDANTPMSVGLEICQTSRVARCVETPAYESNDLSLIPRPTEWKKEVDSRFSSGLPMRKCTHMIDR